MVSRLALFALAGLLSPRLAGAEERYESPRSLGMGSALRGAAAANASLYTNPAGLASAKLFHLEAAYQYESAERGHAGNASVVDSTTPVAGGFGATYQVWDPIQRIEGYDLRLSLALPASDFFYLGATGKYFHLDASRVAPDAPPGTEPGPVAEGITFDAGAMARLGDAITVGVSGYNLRRLPSDLVPIGVGGGIGVAPFDLLLVDVDAVYDFPHDGNPAGRYMAGLEYFTAGRYPIRAGYRFDESKNAHDVTVGVGYVDPRFGIDLAGRREVAGGDETVASIALRVFSN
jgi:opacity protein-like surface antigen